MGFFQDEEACKNKYLSNMGPTILIGVVNAS
jgi:hypothetical protein